MNKFLLMPPHFAERFVRYVVCVFKIAADHDNIAHFVFLLPYVLWKAAVVTWMRTKQFYGCALSPSQLELAAQIDIPV